MSVAGAQDNRLGKLEVIVVLARTQGKSTLMFIGLGSFVIAASVHGDLPDR